MFTKIFSQKLTLFLIVFLLSSPLFVLAYSPIVQINEFSPLPVSGSSWVELRNITATPIELTGWQLVNYLGTTTTNIATTSLSGLILPASGIVSLDITLDSDSGTIALLDPSLNWVHSAAYGDFPLVATTNISSHPSVGQSVVISGGPSMWSGTPTRNWFNLSPTKVSILTGFPSDVVTNLVEGGDWTSVTGLSLERSGISKIVWPGTLNLTGSDDITVLQNLSTSLTLDKGYVKLDVLSPSALADNNVEVTMSGLPLTYTRSDLVVSDLTAIISGFTFSTTSDGGLITFTSNKLATFSVATTAPVVEEIVVPPVEPPHHGGGGGGYTNPLGGQLATSTGLVLGTSTFRFPRYLSQGLKGIDVQELQKRLKLEGFFLGETTRYFGPLTKKAVISYQKAHQIKPVTGVVAKATLAKLNFSASSILTVR